MFYLLFTKTWLWLFPLSNVYCHKCQSNRSHFANIRLPFVIQNLSLYPDVKLLFNYKVVFWPNFVMCPNLSWFTIFCLFEEIGFVKNSASQVSLVSFCFDCKLLFTKDLHFMKGLLIEAVFWLIYCCKYCIMVCVKLRSWLIMWYSWFQLIK
jgi:hypothetical protein